ncbi:crotonase [Advenella kashmirensis W13003]|uniref:Crotonase n=1 Tax=Advenella kashmirensis W13003 TaxID=1424334 RepID=V8QSA6_9BURK|nr:enoyl-CoA hydratase-related protein [Advenella kashmirensis]ETF02218.1 crotonase [Advenella kashmirensis W13003]
MSSEIVVKNLGEHVYEIWMNRPDRMNALGKETVIEFRLAIRDVARRNARVVLIRGSGRGFCAGADLKQRAEMNFYERLDHNAGINDVVNAIAEARFVSIAVMNGVALGGGLELAMGCDLRFAASGISLGLTESRVGAFPGAGGTQRLPRLVGVSRALQMMLSGEPVSSEYALSIGLVNEVIEQDQLEARAHEFANLLAGRSAPAMDQIKRLVYRGIERPLEDALRMERAALPSILGSADYAEGLAAFAEKRPPTFTSVVE